MLIWKDILTIAENGNPTPNSRVEKTDIQWREFLTPAQYQITRQSGTEPPFSSASCTRFEPGEYYCVCCDVLLFDASSKFDSGSGWPSFTQPATLNVIAYHADHSHGMTRIEATCNVCDAHLGHVFPDGPKPTGLRYCMNALALVKK